MGDFDDEETLNREMLLQYCCSVTKKPSLQWLKDKYGDRLGLPLVLWKNNPLRFSVAHRLHGFGMFTGWPSGQVTNVVERIQNDSKSNMWMESWFLNSAKMDMADEYYEILTKAEIRDPKTYNPKATFQLINAVPSLEELTAEEHCEDDFAAATSHARRKRVSQ